RRRAGPGCSRVDQLVAGLVDRGGHGGAVERPVGGDRDPASAQVDLDAGHALHLPQLGPHGGDAVLAAHPGHGVGGRGHGASSRLGGRTGGTRRWTGTPYPFTLTTPQGYRKAGPGAPVTTTEWRPGERRGLALLPVR